MKKIIRLTESDLHRIVRQSVMRILKEDGELGGSSFGDGSSVTPGASSASSDRVGPYTTSITQGMIRKPSPTGEKINPKQKQKNIIQPNDETISREGRKGGFSVNGKAEWNVN